MLNILYHNWGGIIYLYVEWFYYLLPRKISRCNKSRIHVMLVLRFSLYQPDQTFWENQKILNDYIRLRNITPGYRYRLLVKITELKVISKKCRIQNANILLIHTGFKCQKSLSKHHNTLFFRNLIICSLYRGG